MPDRPDTASSSSVRKDLAERPLLSPNKKRTASLELESPRHAKKPCPSKSKPAKGTTENLSTPFTHPNIQALPQAIRQSFCEGMSAIRIHIELLQQEISKILELNHSETPDLIVSEIAEMKSVLDNLKARDGKIASILDSGRLL